MTTHEPSEGCTCRECCVDRAAQVYVDALARRDSRTPEDAAIAAGARTPQEISALAAEIRADREQHLNPSAWNYPEGHLPCHCGSGRSHRECVGISHD